VLFSWAITVHGSVDGEGNLEDLRPGDPPGGGLVEMASVYSALSLPSVVVVVIAALTVGSSRT
jgi:hypothetical protein